MLGVFNALMTIVKVIVIVISIVPAILIGVIKVLIIAFDIVKTLATLLPTSFYVFVVALVAISIIYKIINREGKK